MLPFIRNPTELAFRFLLMKGRVPSTFPPACEHASEMYFVRCNIFIIRSYLFLFK